MDTSALEAAYESLLSEARASSNVDGREPGNWAGDTVLAHVIAASRMLAAATAEILSGRVPVVDNRPTQSPLYLGAIVDAAGGRDGLVVTLQRAGREVVLLARRLDPETAATKVPTIILDGGCYRVEQPVPIASLLDPAHVLEHVGQLEELSVERGAALPRRSQ